MSPDEAVTPRASSPCLYRRSWKTTKPPSTAWPSSFTTCTGRRWRFSRRCCEGQGRAVPHDGTAPLGSWRGLGLLGEERSWNCLDDFQCILIALNKMKCRSRHSFRSWPGRPWFRLAPWLPVPGRRSEPWWPGTCGGRHLSEWVVLPAPKGLPRQCGPRWDARLGTGPTAEGPTALPPPDRFGFAACSAVPCGGHGH